LLETAYARMPEAPPAERLTDVNARITQLLVTPPEKRCPLTWATEVKMYLGFRELYARQAGISVPPILSETREFRPQSMPDGG
jgi:hypothetical protein